MERLNSHLTRGERLLLNDTLEMKEPERGGIPQEAIQWLQKIFRKKVLKTKREAKADLAARELGVDYIAVIYHPASLSSPGFIAISNFRRREELPATVYRFSNGL